MRILVTGGCGFIGQHLCTKLVEDGHDVICLDNLASSDKKGIEHLWAYTSFEFVRHDITEPYRAEVDQIYHLACPAAPRQYQADPVKTLRTCFTGTLNMLGLARRTGATLLLASTSEIYGDPLESPQRESYFGHVNPVGPRSCYDEGKRVAETLCMDHAHQYGTDVRIARIFNTYGPGMLPNDGRVMTTFLTQALGNEPITIYGDGTQTRSFCYVEDMVRGLISLMNSKCEGPVNLGNPEEISIRTLAKLIRRKTASTSSLVYQTLPKDDPSHRRPCIRRARQELRWTPHVRLDEGLDRILTYLT